MKFSSFKYLVKQGWHSMLQNRLMSLASLGVLAACLFITGVAVLLSVNVNSYVDYLSGKNEVRAFLSDELTDEELGNIGAQLSALDNVADCTFISKAQAIEEMKQWAGDDAYLYEDFEGEDNPANPLPASYSMRIVDISRMSETVQAIVAIGGDGFVQVNAPSALTGVLQNMKRAVSYVGCGLIIVLGVVSVVVISNTIRLTVFARRKEINIMKYVGATNAFIRLPFFVEGMTVGALAGLLSTGFVCGLYAGVLHYVAEPSASWIGEFTAALLPLSVVWWPLLIVFVVFGMFIGGVGCATSIRKHLKV